MNKSLVSTRTHTQKQGNSAGVFHTSLSLSLTE
jgi:hypothetical protein